MIVLIVFVSYINMIKPLTDTQINSFLLHLRGGFEVGFDKIISPWFKKNLTLKNSDQEKFIK